MKRSIRIGAGSARWGHRIEPARLNAEQGDLDYICFETMAEATVSPAQVRAEQGLEPCLVDGRVPSQDPGHLGRVLVHTDDLVSRFREAHAADQPDIACPDDRDAHQASAAARLWEYQTRDRRNPSVRSIEGSYPSSVRALVIAGQRRVGLSTR